MSDLHADGSGKLEISCVSTIPAKIQAANEYADFQVYNVKSEYLLISNRIKKLLAKWNFKSQNYHLILIIYEFFVESYLLRKIIIF